MSKKNSALTGAVQKIDFWGPHLGGFLGESPPKNFGRKNCVCSSTTLHNNQISMFCGLGEEERARIRKKKKKKTSSVITAKSGLVRTKG